MHFVLTLLHIVALEMVTRFRQDMYARIKAKKNEPLSSIDQKRPRVTGKEVIETTLSMLTLPEPRAASPTVSLKELTPCRPKKTRSGDKGKGKIDATIWENAATTLGRAHNVVTPDKLKGLAKVPSHKLVNRHIHKLVQLPFIHMFVCTYVYSFS